MNTKLLRQKILDLAIRGKLTEQKKSDGTTRDLLKQIRDERTGEALQTRDASTCHCEAQKRRGNLKQSKSATPKEIIPLDKSEAPFEIPENWEWVRLGDMCSVLSDGIHGTPVYDPEGEYFFVNGNNLNNCQINIKADTKRVSESEFLKYQKPLNDKSILVSINGTIGNVGYYCGEPVILGKSACYFNLFSVELKPFITECLLSSYFVNYATSNATGSTIKNVSLKTMYEWQIPLPPLAEQQRIVTAIESAFAEITEIENNQELLKKHIKQGRQKILDLAIRGKLTQQLKTDGTTKDLLKQIQDERTGEALQTRDASTCHCEAQKRRGNLKQSKSAFSKEIIPLDKTTAPFEIPEKWEWVKLGDICGYGDCDNVDVKKIENDAWILELEDIEKDSGKIIQHFAKSERAINGVRHSFKKGDILYSKLRTYLNKVLVAPEDGFCTTEIMPIKTKEISSAYLCLVLRSQYFLDYTTMCGYGVKMPRLSTADAKNGLIPLPPLAEQQRIVATIEQAFAEFDAMEKHYS